MDENVTITRDYSRNQPSDNTMSHQILHVKVELRTRRTITITITKDYSRNQSSDSTMSHLPRTTITITITMNVRTYQPTITIEPGDYSNVKGASDAHKCVDANITPQNCD